MRRSIAFVFTSLVSVFTHAREQTVVVDFHNAWYLSLGEITLDQDTASNEGIKDTATYLRIAWSGSRRGFVYGAGVSAFFYSDREGFDQLVEDDFGNIEERDSSADAFNGFFELGYGVHLNDYIALDLLGGFEAVIQSERGIDNCRNCDSEDIDIDSGLFLTPRFRFQADNGLTLMLNYHQYLSGDVERAFSASFGWTY